MHEIYEWMPRKGGEKNPWVGEFRWLWYPLKNISFFIYWSAGSKAKVLLRDYLYSLITFDKLKLYLSYTRLFFLYIVIIDWSLIIHAAPNGVHVSLKVMTMGKLGKRNWARYLTNPVFILIKEKFQWLNNQEACSILGT